MGRELTKRYLSPEKKKLKNPIAFIQDVYKSGKSREFVSFIVWELLHKTGLFPNEKYLRLNNSDVINLSDGRIIDLNFNKKIHHYFETRALNLWDSHHNWKLLFINDNKEIFGCLYPDDLALYKSVDNGKSITFVHRFPDRIKSIYISSQNIIFVCIPGFVYISSDNGDSFERTLELGSPVSFFRHNNGITETPDKTLIIAEYGNIWDKNGWRKLAYLYFSTDHGETWDRSDFLITKGTNKHVHLVKYSKLLNKILVADGDNKKKLWISDAIDSSNSKKPHWNLVNRFHIQMGGYTSIIESDGKIVFGTDYQGGTNFIVETKDGKEFSKRIVPDPYRRSPIDNMVQRKSKKGFEIWANLPYSQSGSKCLLMYTDNGGQSWNKVIEYSRSTHKVWLLNSSRDISDELYFSVEDSKNNERIVYRIADE